MGKGYFLLAGLVAVFACLMGEPCLAAGEAAGGYLSGYENATVPQPAAMSWWSTIAYLVSLFVVFAFVVGMAYLAARFVGGHFAKPMAGQGGRIVSHLPLGPNRSVCIVEMAGKFFMLGVTEHQITLLGEVTDEEEIGRLRHQESSMPLGADMFSSQFGSLAGLAQKIPPLFRK